MTHPVDKLLEQDWYKTVASLLQLVRFYICMTMIQTGIIHACSATDLWRTDRY